MAETTEQLIIFDTTLRDGEQSPGISLNVEEKVEIADQLGRLGVNVIEAGFPMSSDFDFEAVSAVADTFSGNELTVICGLARTSLKDIDRCWEAIEPAKRRRIHTFIATSERHMRGKLKMSPEQVMEEAIRGVAHAKSYTPDVEFSPEDATRSDPDFMYAVIQAAVDAGATTINIPDTVGWAQPEQFGKLIANVRRRVAGDYIISTHCHNDLGLAVANSMAGVSAGARQVEVAVNGIGERAGNAALEEVVMNLMIRSDYFSGIATTVRTDELMATSRMVSRMTGYPVQFNKAVVGRNAFAHEAGIHQDGMLKDRETYEIIDPASVGQVSSLDLGKHSGTNAVSSRLEVLGLPITNAREVRDACKAYSESNGGRNISDVELEQIAAKITGEVLIDRVSASSIETRSFDTDATARVKCNIEGEELILEAKSHGEIEAAIKAISEAYQGYEIVDWDAREANEQHGATAVGGIHINVATPSGQVISSYAEHINVVHATVHAFIAAINISIRTDERMA